MKWQLWLWYPGGPSSWIPVGESVDGVNDKIRQAVMAGLLRKFPGGIVYAYSAAASRSEQFYSPDGGTSLFRTA